MADCAAPRTEVGPALDTQLKLGVNWNPRQVGPALDTQLKLGVNWNANSGQSPLLEPITLPTTQADE